MMSDVLPGLSSIDLCVRVCVLCVCLRSRLDGYLSFCVTAPQGRY